MNWLQDILNRLEKIFTWWVVVNPWEAGVRIFLGKKVKLLTPGVWAKIPFLHVVRTQSIRLRILDSSLQTVTSADGVTISLQMAIGVSISNVGELYNTLDSPGATICSMAQGIAADFISNTAAVDCKPDAVAQKISDTLQATKYGLKFESVKITHFAVVKTYRLMGDKVWYAEGFDMAGLPTPK